jgi:hypothetical protein
MIRSFSDPPAFPFVRIQAMPIQEKKSSDRGGWRLDGGDAAGSCAKQGESMKAAAALLTCALAISAPAWADDWHGDTNYPARVAAFTFGSGLLNSNHSVRFGAWTVSFNGQGVQTVYIQSTPTLNWYHTGKPYSLICANAVLGQTSCAMWLIPAKPPNSRDTCKMALLPAIGTIDMLEIPCPTSITFQR